MATSYECPVCHRPLMGPNEVCGGSFTEADHPSGVKATSAATEKASDTERSEWELINRPGTGVEVVGPEIQSNVTVVPLAALDTARKEERAKLEAAPAVEAAAKAGYEAERFQLGEPGPPWEDVLAEQGSEGDFAQAWRRRASLYLRAAIASSSEGEK